MAIERNFFLAKLNLWETLVKPVLTVRILVICGLLNFCSDALAQSCDCPAANVCSTCSGGLSRLTLRFNGTIASVITASDQQGLVYTGLVIPGGTFSFAGSIVNEKFVGPTVYLTVTAILNATIGSVCGSAYPGSVFGSFTVVSAESKNGGILCCLPESIEKIAPVISNCPASFAVNLPASSCSMAVNWTAPTATDNCTLDTFIPTHSPGGIFALGNTPVTYTARDSYGNTSSCSFTVTVNDVTPPVITGCPVNITVPVGASCKASASWIAPTATDNCTVSMTSNHVPGEQFALGVTPVTYTATDGKGNVSTCSFNVIVEDKIAPVITACPVNIVTNANSSCQAMVNWVPPAATDHCLQSFVASHDPGATFPLGNTTVTYTATDKSGNTATCSFNVSVVNSLVPAISGCPDNITVNANAAGVASVTWAEPLATVQCGTVSVTRSHSPGGSFDTGTHAVTYEFEDETGKSAQCTFSVIVLERESLFAVSKVVTPDGDGINDFWLITNIENYKINSVVVIDRWGNIIFTATGYDNQKVFWDGTNKNGKIVPTGTYFYTIEVRQQDVVVQKKGFLEVIQ